MPNDRFVALFIAILIPLFAIGQHLTLFNINTNEYPVIEAQFIALDERGEINYNLKQQNMNVLRDSSACKIVSFRNPSKHMGRYSIVLVFDISGSMNGDRMEMARSAAKAFLDEIQLAFSEVAVLSFNEDVVVNTDFTSNYNHIVQTIDELKPIGGTSYNHAFLSPRYGAFDVASKGRYERFVVFLTDGLCSASTDTIARMANQVKATVFTLTVDMPMPGSLKYIAQQTGGSFFEGITNKAQAREIYKLIAGKIHATRFGSVKWLTDTDCSKQHSGTIHIPFADANYSYQVPPESYPILRALPDLVFLEKEMAGQTISQSIKLIASNNAVEIGSIRFENNSTATTKHPETPFKIQPGSAYNLQVEYPIPASGYFADKLWISTPNCGDFPILFSGGSQPAFVITSPKTGDRYTLGSDVPVEWKGVSYQKDIELTYVRHENAPMDMAIASGLAYEWPNAPDTGSYVINGNPNLGFDMMPILTARYGSISVEETDASMDGKKFLTRDEQRYIKVWSAETGEMLHNAYQYSSPNLFDTKSNAVVTFGNGKIQRLDLTTAVAESYAYPNKSYIVQAFHTSRGEEYYIPLIPIIKQRDLSRVWDPINDHFLSLTINNPPLDIALSTDGNSAVILHNEKTISTYHVIDQQYTSEMQLDKGYNRLVVSPHSKIMVAVYPESIVVYDLEKKQMLHRFYATKFIRFGHTNNTLLVRKTKKLMAIDIPTGKTLLEIDEPRHYKLSSNDAYLAYWNNDTLRVQQMGTPTPWYISNAKTWDAYTFTAHSDIFLHVKSGEAFAYMCKSGKAAGSIRPDEADIMKLIAFPSSHKLISLNSDNSFTVWVNKEPQEAASSGQFHIVDPRPTVQPVLHMGSCVTGTTIEKTFRQYIFNPNDLAINIDTIELQSNTTRAFEIISDVSSSTLMPLQYRAIEVRFHAELAKAYQAKLLVKTRKHQYETNVLAEGVEPRLKWLTNRIDMGRIQVGSTKDSLATIMLNISTDQNCNIASVRLVPEKHPAFSLQKTNTVNTLIAPGESLQQSIHFHPSYKGMQSARMEITTNDNQVFQISITGEGHGPAQHVVVGELIDNETNIRTTGLVYYNDLRSMLLMGKHQSADGRFLFEVEPGRIYTFGAEKQGYISAGHNLDLTSYPLPDTSFIKIELMKAQQGKLFDLRSVFFETDKANLLPASTLELNRVIQQLKHQPNLRVEIRGHTDERGTHAYNMSLSQARADAVKAYLLQKGINIERITTKAFGETQPLSTEKNEHGFQINRRVEIVFK